MAAAPGKPLLDKQPPSAARFVLSAVSFVLTGVHLLRCWLGTAGLSIAALFSVQLWHVLSVVIVRYLLTFITEFGSRLHLAGC